MEEEDKDLELRSEEVKEIMGNPPSWIIRWGSTLAFGVVAILLLFAWLVQWPDLRTASIELTTAIPPAEVVSTFDGNIETILVKSGEAVKAGNLLAVLQTTGNFEDILFLREDLKELQEADQAEILNYSPEKNHKLGELSSNYATFVTYFESYILNENSDVVERSVSQLQQARRQVNESIEILMKALRSVKGELRNEEANMKRLQKLYQDGIVSQFDLEKVSTDVGNARVKVQNVRSSISSKRRELTRIDQEIIGLRDSKQKTTSFDLTRFTQEIVRLQSAIDKWEEKYLLRAPIDGTISFPDATKENQFVKKGQPILNVLPDKGGGWICVGELPAAGSAKVERGQHVVIKFENYPYEEYGSVFGEVSDIALMPSGRNYHLEVSLVDGLNTTQKESLNYNQGMTGTAEITVQERRLLMLFFDKLMAKVRRR